MKAARIQRYGDADVIRLEDVPRPVPGSEEALLRVAATSFNPSDAALRSGMLREVLPVSLPYTLGMDVSGTIAEVGQGIEGLAPGDRVIGRLDSGGAAAEYVAARADELAKAPVAIPLTDAAAVPIAAYTAWQALYEHARIDAGQRVFINGAGGGVGMFAVQLTRRAGATIIATASARSAAAVSRYGADEIIDYTTTPIADALKAPVDIAFNLVAVSAEEAANLVALVRPGGAIVSISTPVEVPPDADVSTTRFVARNDTQQLAEIVKLIDTGVLVVDVTESHPLSDVALIHRRSESGQIHGKVTLIP